MTITINVEAVQWLNTEESAQELESFTNGQTKRFERLLILRSKAHGRQYAYPGDYIVKGKDGNMYVVGKGVVDE